MTKYSNVMYTPEPMSSFKDRMCALQRGHPYFFFCHSFCVLVSGYRVTVCNLAIAWKAFGTSTLLWDQVCHDSV